MKLLYIPVKKRDTQIEITGEEYRKAKVNIFENIVDLTGARKWRSAKELHDLTYPPYNPHIFNKILEDLELERHIKYSKSFDRWTLKD